MTKNMVIYAWAHYTTLWAGVVGLIDLGGKVLEVEVRGVEKDVIPYVGQLVFSSVPVGGWIIDPYVHSLLNGPGKSM